MFFHLLGSANNTCVWTGLAGDNNWSTNGNWLPNVVPGPNDIAQFKGSACSGAACNATINVDANIGALNIDAAYAGTITQGSGKSISVGIGGWSQLGGVFLGSDKAREARPCQAWQMADYLVLKLSLRGAR